MSCSRPFNIQAAGTKQGSNAELLLSAVPDLRGLRRRVVVFWEIGFPVVDSMAIEKAVLKQALNRHKVSFVNAAGLGDALAADPDLIILPYGSAFPKCCWTAFTAYLKRGGRWLNLGGAPLTRPVRRERDGWSVEESQVAYGKECLIRHTWEIPLPTPVSLRVPDPEKMLDEPGRLTAALATLKPERVWSLQVMLSESGPMFQDPGATGSRQAVFRPLVQAVSEGGEVLAAAVTMLDALHGPFMGGRWVLVSCYPRKPFSVPFIRAACEQVLMPAVRLEVRPGFGCYYPGESGTAVIRASSRQEQSLEIEYEVVPPKGRRGAIRRRFITACGLSDSFVSTEPVKLTQTGLYVIRAKASLAGGRAVVAVAENGFWLYDEKLMASAQPLTIDRDYFLRGGKPFPVTGTTYMSTETHRSWMLEPTPMAWDRDFAAMKRAGVNLVRTGFWMAWRRMMQEPGAMDEGVVRAVQAFVLCARRHDLPVIMTLFAFLPEAWNGANPYLDPSAVAAQSSFVSALSRRLATANHLLWDFINEPSFANAQHLWSCRPAGDRVEAEAWIQWLAEQAVGEDEWRERWRLTPNAPLAIPELKDFGDRHNTSGTCPLRVPDFVRFGQEVFATWAATLREVIRRNGNPNQWVTVGQDEAGTGCSPSPHFHAASVDFTSNHPWWQNDDTLWDSVITKTGECPNLMQEAGVMFAEALDGRPWRTQERVRDLLERKMALSFACGCAGFVEWLWNTAVYNLSDNESGIGLLRPDGSAKPELAALSGIAAFMKRNAGRMVGRERERVVVVIPHSNVFSARNTADTATRRCVRTLEYRMGVACRAASEMFPERIGQADLIVLPSPRVLREECWQAVLARVKTGATLLLSGYVEADEYWRTVPRLKLFGIETRPVEIFHEECLILSPETPGLRMAFPAQEWQNKAVDQAGRTLPLLQFKHGRGRIAYCPVPVEHALAEEHTEAVYRIAAQTAGVKCCRAADSEGGPGLLIRPVIFSHAVLFIVSNESSVDQPAVMRGEALGSPAKAWQQRIMVPAGRTAMLFVNRATGRLLDEYRPQ